MNFILQSQIQKEPKLPIKFSLFGAKFWLLTTGLTIKLSKDSHLPYQASFSMVVCRTDGDPAIDLSFYPVMDQVDNSHNTGHNGGGPSLRTITDTPLTSFLLLKEA